MCARVCVCACVCVCVQQAHSTLTVDCRNYRGWDLCVCARVCVCVCVCARVCLCSENPQPNNSGLQEL